MFRAIQYESKIAKPVLMEKKKRHLVVRVSPRSGLFRIQVARFQLAYRRCTYHQDQYPIVNGPLCKAGLL
jgi:hypothetical protein